MLQWIIPSHCGILGNELADKLAKLGAEDQQEENPVNLSEMINHSITLLYLMESAKGQPGAEIQASEASFLFPRAHFQVTSLFLFFSDLKKSV